MTIPQFQVLYFVFHVNAVLLVLFIHDKSLAQLIPLLLLLSAELLQTVQGDGSCYGDCMIVSTPKCLLQLYQVYVQLTEETLT